MGLTAKEIRDYANGNGINLAPKLKKVEDLIRALQLAEGNTDCFKKIPDCGLINCKWFGDCVKQA